jgi:soluble lytic murein transglycosylase-like protein
MAQTAYREQIEEAAAKHKLDPNLVEAIVVVESSGDPWAWNPEPHYRYLWDVRRSRPFRRLTPAEIASQIPPSDFSALAGDRDQEWWAQQASWGLMQIMGAVARENGFKGRFLTELSDPVVNLEYGCKHLAGLMRWAKWNATQALAAYNGGRAGNVTPPYRNQGYANKALKVLEAIRAA